MVVWTIANPLLPEFRELLTVKSGDYRIFQSCCTGYGTGVMNNTVVIDAGGHGARTECNARPDSSPNHARFSQHRRTCELCRATAPSDAELQRHITTAHAGWVDRLVISICLAS
jgi:hypothetical protein